ncbi:MAG: hypothetical protein KAX46_02765 [Chromatiaceae bacterium]|nr:hypothetical protein [Chromatiaceae bacterium]
MMPVLLAIPAKLATLLTRLSSARASNLDNLNATISSRSTLTQAQAAAGVWAAASRTLTSSAAVIKSVQRGTVQLTGTALTASVSITAVTATKAFIVQSYAGPWDTDATSRVRLALASNGLTVVATRFSYGAGVASSIVAYEVVEFY